MECNTKTISSNIFGLVRYMYYDDKLWFVGSDVAKSLGYSNCSKALKDYVTEVNKTKNDDMTVKDSLGRIRNPIFINSEAIIELSKRSGKSNQFIEWVQSKLSLRIDDKNGNNTTNICGVTCYEEDGIAYLKLENVAYGLGFTQMKNGIEYVKWERVAGYLNDIGFPQKCGKDYSTHKDLSGMFIPENIFYRLAMKAKNPAAEAFQAKVADEIIPSIRRTGGYISGEKEMDDDELVARAFVVLQNKLKDRDEQIGLLKNENTALKPKANYFDSLANTNLLINLRDTAKELGVPPLVFNNWLRDNDYIYYDSRGSIKPYQAKNDGLFVMKEVMIRHGGSRIQTFVTQKGRDKFLKLIQQKKLLA